MAEPNVSHAEILHRLKYAIADEARTLKTAYTNAAPISMVAWLARNILELLIWIRYCSKSPELAQKFLTDSIRDTIETLEVGKKLAPNPEALAGAKDSLIETALEDGYRDLDEQFTYVSEAAKEIGAAEAFKTYNKLLSKFAIRRRCWSFRIGKSRTNKSRKRSLSLRCFLPPTGNGSWKRR